MEEIIKEHIIVQVERSISIEVDLTENPLDKVQTNLIRTLSGQ